MTGGDDPRERADGWFDIHETTSISGLQALLDSIGTLRARLTAGDTGLNDLTRQALLACNATGMPRDTIRPPGPMGGNPLGCGGPAVAPVPGRTGRPHG